MSVVRLFARDNIIIQSSSTGKKDSELDKRLDTLGQWKRNRDFGISHRIIVYFDIEQK
jgi:hypothetical protein